MTLILPEKTSRKKLAQKRFSLPMAVLLLGSPLAGLTAAPSYGAEAVSRYVAAIPVTGKVTDSKGQPLVGVSILEKGTANGTVTDTNGNFKLNVAGSSAVLVFNYVGFTSREVAVNGQTVLSVTLVYNTEKLTR